MASKASKHSFIYESTGKELIFDVNFVLNGMWLKSKSVKPSVFKKLVKVYFVSDKQHLNLTNQTAVKPKTMHADTMNLRLNLEFKPRKGFFIVTVRPLLDHDFIYRLELNTDHVSQLLTGRRVVTHIGCKSVDHTYEIVTSNPGSLFLKRDMCLGEVSM